MLESLLPRLQRRDPAHRARSASSRPRCREPRAVKPGTFAVVRRTVIESGCVAPDCSAGVPGWADGAHAFPQAVSALPVRRGVLHFGVAYNSGCNPDASPSCVVHASPAFVSHRSWCRGRHLGDVVHVPGSRPAGRGQRSGSAGRFGWPPTSKILLPSRNHVACPRGGAGRPRWAPMSRPVRGHRPPTGCRRRPRRRRLHCPSPPDVEVDTCLAAVSLPALARLDMTFPVGRGLTTASAGPSAFAAASGPNDVAVYVHDLGPPGDRPEGETSTGRGCRNPGCGPTATTCVRLRPGPKGAPRLADPLLLLCAPGASRTRTGRSCPAEASAERRALLPPPRRDRGASTTNH